MSNLFFATTKGTIKKTEITEYENIRQSGLTAIALEKDDQLLSVSPTTGKDKILLIAASGKCIMFDENDVRPTGRNTRGVRGISLKGDDHLVGMEVIHADEETENYQVLVVSENGYGKKTSLAEYNLQGRGGQGVFAAKTSPKTGKLVAMRLLRIKSSDAENPDEADLSTSDLLVISQQGQTIRLSLDDVPTLGRHTQGVRIIRLNANDKATALALL
jgi:DNA gyrase subunit A